MELEIYQEYMEANGCVVGGLLLSRFCTGCTHPIRENCNRSARWGESGVLQVSPNVLIIDFLASMITLCSTSTVLIVTDENL